MDTKQFLFDREASEFVGHILNDHALGLPVDDTNARASEWLREIIRQWEYSKPDEDEGTHCFNMASSGDKDEDKKAAAAFRLRTIFVNRNLCPNFCGPMNVNDDSMASCPDCGFVQHRHVIGVG